MKEMPADYSKCPNCEEGIVRHHSGGATCHWCGLSWYGEWLTEFRELENGDMYVNYDAYPDSTHYEHADWEKIVWVKAENEKDFPVARNHRYNNVYRADKPEIQGSRGPYAKVIRVAPLNTLLTDGGNEP